MHLLYIPVYTYRLGQHWVSHPLTLVRAARCFNHGEKTTKCGKSPGGVRDYGGNSCRAQGTTGLLDKNSRLWSPSTLTLFFPRLFAVLVWTCHSIRAQEDTGLLDKEALSPFGRLHVPSNLCLPRLQTPVWCRAPLIINERKRKTGKKNLDPINYSIYQILCTGFQASIGVMWNALLNTVGTKTMSLAFCEVIICFYIPMPF